jgi:aryl-alcohol dehydrogenase-like predicted oxidoreductase
MTLIDTAEVYGNGRSKLIGRVIASQRDGVFRSGVAHSRDGNGIAGACEASLARLGTNYLDLYLLHWPQGVTNLAGVVAGFEIYAWREDSRLGRVLQSATEDLFRVPDDRCATVRFFSLGTRIEHDLLPWCELREHAVMAYLARRQQRTRPTIARIGATRLLGSRCRAGLDHRSGNVIAIPDPVRRYMRERRRAVTDTDT